MELISRDCLARNAFRVLGLPADAPQDAIVAAARRMRIWPDSQRIPPTAWDLPWLGPISRTRNDLERAVAELKEPATRIAHRVLWYAGGNESLGKCTASDLEYVATSLAAVNTSAAQHGAVLARVHLVVLQDPQAANEQWWTAAVEGIRNLVNSQPYHDWLLQIDQQGNFQIPLRPEEIEQTLAEWEQALVGTLVAQVQEQLSSGETQQGARLHRLIQRMSPGKGGGSNDSAVLDRMEDLLQQRCRELIDDLTANVVTDPYRFELNQRSNAGAAKSATEFHQKIVQPLLNELESLCAADEARLQRMRYPVARAVAATGTAWVWSGQYVKADFAFRSALELAKGSSLEARIRASLQENEQRARQQGMSYSVATGDMSGASTVAAKPQEPEVVYISADNVVTGARPKESSTQAKPAATAPKPRPEPVRTTVRVTRKGSSYSRPAPAKRQASGGRLLGILATLVVFMVIRAAVSTIGTSSSDSHWSAYPNPSPQPDWRQMARQLEENSGVRRSVPERSLPPITDSVIRQTRPPEPEILRPLYERHTSDPSNPLSTPVTPVVPERPRPIEERHDDVAAVPTVPPRVKPTSPRPWRPGPSPATPPESRFRVEGETTPSNDPPLIEDHSLSLSPMREPQHPPAESKP